MPLRMISNDVLRSVRYMLNVSEETLASIIRLGGIEVPVEEVSAYLLRDDQPGYRPCHEKVMNAFLDGLVTHRRGPREDAKPRPPEPLTNNVVMKKLRVAFELREDDLLEMMKAAGFQVSRPEMSALFRAPGHNNYRPCGDQFLRNFLKSLTARVRPERG